MQDRTINNALVAIYRAGGEQAQIAAQLMSLRGAPHPTKLHDRPLSRGLCRHIVLDALRNGPKTCRQIGEQIQAQVPGITARAAANRAYQALLRLEEAGKVKRVGARMWRLA